MQVLKRFWQSLFGYKTSTSYYSTNMTPEQRKHFDAAFEKFSEGFQEAEKIFDASRTPKG